MKLSQLNELIGSLVEYHEKGRMILEGQVNGITLTEEQIETLKARCILIKYTAISVAQALSPGIFDLEQD